MVDYAETVCIVLGIPRATHPLDGGTHVTRLATGGSLDDLITSLREMNPKSILSIEMMKFFDIRVGEETIAWKVSGLWE